MEIPDRQHKLEDRIDRFLKSKQKKYPELDLGVK